MTTLERRIAAVESRNPSRAGPDVVFVTFMETAEHKEAVRASLSRPDGASINREADEVETAFVERVAALARRSLPPGHCALVFMHPA